VHGSLGGRTPAMSMGLSDRIWSVVEYVRHPVHVDGLSQAISAKEREKPLISALERQKHETPYDHREALPRISFRFEIPR
jgi:hypothetical protein